MAEFERAVKKLSASDVNKKCADCGKISEHGYSNVCTKFNIFVCDLCKSAHQSFSHRVKSISQSTWTRAEVEALREKNGGGNLCNRKRFYASFVKKSRPATLDDHKRLIHDVYEKRLYLAASDESAGEVDLLGEAFGAVAFSGSPTSFGSFASPSSSPRAVATSPQMFASTSSFAPPVSIPATTSPPLDLFASAPPLAAAPPVSIPATTSSPVDLFTTSTPPPAAPQDDPFLALQTTRRKKQPPPSASGDPFLNMRQATTSRPVQDPNDPFFGLQ